MKSLFMKMRAEEKCSTLIFLSISISICFNNYHWQSECGMCFTPNWNKERAKASDTSFINRTEPVFSSFSRVKDREEEGKTLPRGLN